MLPLAALVAGGLGTGPAAAEAPPPAGQDQPSPQTRPAAPAVVAEVTRELLKRNTDPGGWPLPVVGHWARSYGGRNFSSDYQVSLLEAGHHVLPNLPMPEPGQKPPDERGQALLRKLAAWGAPFSLRAGQWEQLLLSKDHPADAPGKWRNAPPDKTALTVQPDGTAGKYISAWGAIEPWREVGRYFSSSEGLQSLQKLYPDPPLVIFLSNNEARRLKTKLDVASLSKRFVDRYGADATKATLREALAEGYIPRYRALLTGMREGLVNDGWRKAAKFVAYGAFGPSHFGRWDGWTLYSAHTDQRMVQSHLVWDGSSPSYYTHNWDASTDYRVWSPQVESMNWVFMLKEVYRDRPDYWFEISVWDGNFAKPDEKGRSKMASYLKAGQTWTPQRYAGFTLFGAWLLRPRVVREYRGHGLPREDFRLEFEAVVAGIDRIWQDGTLRRFWRRGTLVANRKHKHPFQTDIPKRWADVDRWFLLDTSLDPKRPWSLEAELPVFALARVIGEPPRREWLLYAHAPVEARSDVEVDLPGFGKLTIDVARGGSYYHVVEATRGVQPVADGPARPAAGKPSAR